MSIRFGRVCQPCCQTLVLTLVLKCSGNPAFAGGYLVGAIVTIYDDESSYYGTTNAQGQVIFTNQAKLNIDYTYTIGSTYGNFTGSFHVGAGTTQNIQLSLVETDTYRCCLPTPFPKRDLSATLAFTDDALILVDPFGSPHYVTVCQFYGGGQTWSSSYGIMGDCFLGKTLNMTMYWYGSFGIPSVYAYVSNPVFCGTFGDAMIQNPMYAQVGLKCSNVLDISVFYVIPCNDTTWFPGLPCPEYPFPNDVLNGYLLEPVASIHGSTNGLISSSAQPFSGHFSGRVDIDPGIGTSGKAGLIIYE